MSGILNSLRLVDSLATSEPIDKYMSHIKCTDTTSKLIFACHLLPDFYHKMKLPHQYKK